MHNQGFFPAWRHQLGPMGRSGLPLRAIRSATLAQVESRLAPALPPDLLQAPRRGAHSRDRIFPLFRTFWCWFWQILQANTSCREVVRQVQALFALQGGAKVDEATGAYCEARKKVPLALLEKAFAASAQSAQRQAEESSVLQGRQLKGLDGSNVRLADTPANRRAYPPSRSAPLGSGFPLLKIVVLFSLASGAILARACGTQLVHEVRICESLRACFTKGDIIVADRAYGIYAIVAWLQSLQTDVIARVPTRLRRVDFRKARQRHTSHDALFLWRRPEKACAFLPLAQWLGLPEQMQVRILRVRVHQAGFRPGFLTLVTTLLDPVAYPAHQIIDAYARRWRLEICLNDLKTTMGMEQLSCHSPKMVEKELLVFLTVYNLLRWLMAQAARPEGVSLERLSFKGTLDAFRQWSLAAAQLGRSPRRNAKRQRLWKRLLYILAADLVPERPGRREPRAVKKPKKYPHLNCPRHQFRDPRKSNLRKSLRLARRRQSLI